MTHHLFTLQIKQLCVSALPEDELAAAAVHTAECKSCDQRFIEELKRQRGDVPFNFTLEPEFWFRNDHLQFDDLVGLAENTFDEETREIINIQNNSGLRLGSKSSHFTALQNKSELRREGLLVFSKRLTSLTAPRSNNSQKFLKNNLDDSTCLSITRHSAPTSFAIAR